MKVKIKQLFEKLMLTEDKQIGKVSFNIYKSLYHYYGRAKFFALFLLLFITFRSITIRL